MAAAWQHPFKMMELITVEAVLRRVARHEDDSYPRQIVIEPELVIRKSTAVVSTDWAGESALQIADSHSSTSRIIWIRTYTLFLVGS